VVARASRLPFLASRLTHPLPQHRSPLPLSYQRTSSLATLFQARLLGFHAREKRGGTSSHPCPGHQIREIFAAVQLLDSILRLNRHVYHFGIPWRDRNNPRGSTPTTDAGFTIKETGRTGYAIRDIQFLTPVALDAGRTGQQFRAQVIAEGKYGFQYVIETQLERSKDLLRAVKPNYGGCTQAN
jgi:hypothetical protein